MAERNDNDVGSRVPGHYGAAGVGVTFSETSIAAAWNVQGDPTRANFTDEIRRRFDITLPIAPNTTARNGALTALWLGPTSWLLVAGGVPSLPDFTTGRDALNAAGGALFDVTASRVAWTIAGPQAAQVLAKGCPLDFHARAFSAGACAQSLLGHVDSLYHRRDTNPAFTVMVARSVARDVWHLLCVSAAQYGYDVLPPRHF